jgi:hypothetical protein
MIFFELLYYLGLGYLGGFLLIFLFGSHHK